MSRRKRLTACSQVYIYIYIHSQTHTEEPYPLAYIYAYTTRTLKHTLKHTHTIYNEATVRRGHPGQTKGWVRNLCTAYTPSGCQIAEHWTRGAHPSSRFLRRLSSDLTRSLLILKERVRPDLRRLKNRLQNLRPTRSCARPYACNSLFALIMLMISPFQISPAKISSINGPSVPVMMRRGEEPIETCGRWPGSRRREESDVFHFFLAPVGGSRDF